MTLPKQEEKKICENLIVAMPLPKQGNKKKNLAIVAMALPKMGGKKIKKNKIVVAEIWGGIKKKCYIHNIFTTFSQQIIDDQLLLVQI